MRGKIITLMIALCLVAGCGSRFSCQHTIDGVRCQNLHAVYAERVLGASETTPLTSYSEKVVKKKKLDRSRNGFFRNLIAQDPSEMDEEMDAEDMTRGLKNDESRPIRIPPMILRIWTAPWEDQDGDLHKAGYIYSEITPPRGRWIIGERNVESGTGYIAPHRAGEVVTEPDHIDKGQKKGKGNFGGTRTGKTASLPPIPGSTGEKENTLTFGGRK